MSITFENATSLFESYQRDILNRSENTILNYKSDILQFQKMLSLDNVDVSKAQAKEYATILAKAGISATSRARKISVLQVFYEWLYQNEYVSINALKSLIKPKIPKTKVLAMNRDEVNKVLEATRQAPKNKYYFRNLAIVNLFLSTGIRRDELCNIKLEDVNTDDNSILIRKGKGDKQRVVYYNDKMKAILCEYISTYRKLQKPSETSEYLFCSEINESLSDRSINEICGRIFKQAGLEHLTVHCFRRTFATMIYEATKDIVTVQNLLGHSSPETTMRYVGINEESKKLATQMLEF